MNVRSIAARFILFALCFAFGVLAVGWLVDPWTEPGFESVTPAAPGSAIGVSGSEGRAAADRSGTNPLNILYRPKATYTDEARANEAEGAVRLKITLLASGNVGAVTVIKGLPYGLTERAIAAARQIRFQPATVNGVPVSRTVTYEYTFTIY